MCDNPPCVRPAHLFPGSNKDNARDCAQKGRVGVFTKPENYSHIKVNFELAALVRQAEGTQSIIAARFGISQSNVSRIKSGEIWTI